MASMKTLKKVTEFYNDRARRDPTNAPTCRAIAAEFGVSASTAHKWRDDLDRAGRLCWPPRRRGDRIEAES